MIALTWMLCYCLPGLGRWYYKYSVTVGLHLKWKECLNQNQKHDPRVTARSKSLMGHSVRLIDRAFHEPLDSYGWLFKKKGKGFFVVVFVLFLALHAVAASTRTPTRPYGNTAFRATSLQSVFTVCAPVYRTNGLSFEHAWWWEWYGCKKLIVKRHCSCK